MKKSDFYRFWNCFRAIVIGALVFILIYASAMLAPKLISDKSTKLKVYRMSNNESNNCTMNLYNDYVTSLKGVSIQPYATDTQYVIDLKGPYSKISVSTYNSIRKEWEDKDIIALGNEQYSIKPEAVCFDHDHTVTYCVSIENGDDIQKYYFTVKWNSIKSS